jgi:diguanylate cyclase (GGDEF)-like protein
MDLARTTKRAVRVISLVLATFACCAVVSPAVAAERTKLIYTGDHDFPPFEALDAQNRPYGFNVELILALAEVMDIEVEIRLMPWSKALAQLQDGTAHVAAMLPSAERKRLFDFAAHHHVAYPAIFVRKESLDVHIAADLTGKQVIVQRGGRTHELLAKQVPGAVPVLLDSPSEGLMLLASGQFDAFADLEAVGYTLMSQLEIDNLKMVGFLGSSYTYHFAVAKGDQELLTQVDSGLASLKENGRYKVIKEKWLEGGLRAEHYRKQFTTYVLIGSGLLLFLGLFAWTWTLRHQVAEKTAKLKRQASHDALTGLPNRTLLHDRLEHALAHATREGTEVAVLFLDLDGFKDVNDSLGHDAGDELLRCIAGRLLECVRGSDTVARLGGDEFVLVLEGVPDLSEVQQIAERVLAALQQPIPLAERHTQVSGSIGIALTPRDGVEAGSLLKHADAAMYRAKHAGRNNYQFFMASPST